MIKEHFLTQHVYGFHVEAYFKHRDVSADESADGLDTHGPTE